MSLLASILIGVAAQVGAPLVKGILEKQVGGVAGEVGGAVIDAIAAKVGVAPGELPNVPTPELGQAIIEVERETPELVLAHLEQQKETNKLLLAEMDQHWFGWMWRPAGMWLMLACVAWLMFLRPILNGLLWGLGTGVQVELGLDITNFLGIFTVYTGLYMGGHTVLRATKK